MWAFGPRSWDPLDSKACANPLARALGTALSAGTATHSLCWCTENLCSRSRAPKGCEAAFGTKGRATGSPDPEYAPTAKLSSGLRPGTRLPPACRFRRSRALRLRGTVSVAPPASPRSSPISRRREAPGCGPGANTAEKSPKAPGPYRIRERSGAGWERAPARSLRRSRWPPPPRQVWSLRRRSGPVEVRRRGRERRTAPPPAPSVRGSPLTLRLEVAHARSAE